ncbi:MAG: fibronectin type III domain-containing protein [candidate division WOR-3 bacterium]
MKRLMFGVIAFMAMIILVGCGGEAEKLAAPEITRVNVNDTSSVKLTWTIADSIKNHSDFSGYNVYVYLAADSGTLKVEDGEDLQKNNPEVIDDTVYTVNGLKKDSIYAIQVRTVNKDEKVGDYNHNQAFILISPCPVFVKTVYIEWDNSDTSKVALHFSTGEVKKRADISTNWGDMWVDHRITGDTVFFQSAWKADTTAGYRRTKLINIGKFDFDEKWVATEPTKDVADNIKQGDLVFAKTVENNYVKIHVDSVYLDTVGTSWVKITYGYQNIPNLPNLIGRK